MTDQDADLHACLVRALDTGGIGLRFRFHALVAPSSPVFRPREVAGWRSGSLAHLMVQLGWIVTQNSGGGYFVLVGRKRA